MVSSINIAVYSDALVVLGTAGVVVPMVHRFGLSPVLGYLGAGALLGPLGLGSLANHVPLLHWFTVEDAKNVTGIADLGVVFLLFLIGIELSYERLVAMRRLVFGLGMLQVGSTTIVLAVCISLAGEKTPVAIMIGACLALSSTAIVLEVLSAQGRLTTAAGRTSFSVLLAQDLAVIPILMFVSILGAAPGGSILKTVAMSLAQAVAAVALIVLVGRTMLRPLFAQVARTNSSELFIAAILFVIVGTGVVAAVANLSMALGAFVAGLLLAETEYRKAIEATIEPFKGLLLGIFFFTVGMSIDVRELAREPLLLIACVIGLIALKALILALLGWIFRLGRAATIETALVLGPGGEFAFVGLGLAASLGVISKQTASFTLAIASLTMVLIPVLSMLARALNARIEPSRPLDPALSARPESRSQHAIVIGHGRVGKVVCDLLGQHSVAFTAVDHDASAVSADRARGHAVYFGDATSPAFLHACGLAHASAVVVTIHTRPMIDEIVHQVRVARPDVPIFARSRDPEHARHLYSIGVTDTVPETVEASLQLSEATLVGLGVPTGKVIASIHAQRDVFRHALQEAASASGKTATLAIRSTSKVVNRS